MTNSVLIIVALIIGAILAVPVSIFLNNQRDTEPLVNQPTENLFPKDIQKEELPRFDIKESLPGAPEPPRDQTRIEDGTPVAPPPTITALPPPAFAPSLPDIKSLIPLLPSLPPQAAELLPWPEVTDGELNISEDGIADFEIYLEYFTRNSQNLDFDNTKFGALPRNDTKLILLPADLIEQALENDDFRSIHKPLSVFHEFLMAKIEFLKSIGVKGGAIEWNKYMISSDRLTLALIEKTFNLEQNLISQAEFQNYYQRYLATIEVQKREFRTSGGFAIIEEVSPWKSFAAVIKRLMALDPEVAYAQSAAGLSFGGFVTASIECFCIASFNLHMTPAYIPVPSPDFPMLITVATIASPLLFLNKTPETGHWLLGTYIPNGIPPQPQPCLALLPTVPPTCGPIDIFLGVVVMTGTS